MNRVNAIYLISSGNKCHEQKLVRKGEGKECWAGGGLQS